MARSALSQNEVDALLQGMGSGEVKTAASAPAPMQEQTAGPPAYDFSRTELSIHGQLPGLENIFSKFARRLRNIFTSELGKTVYVGLDSLDAVLYEDLVKRLPLPSSIHLVRLDPLRGQCIIVLAAHLAYAMIDIFFGGTGQRMGKAEGREFSPIETSILGKFVTKLLRGIEDAWQPLVQISAHYVSSETNPYLLGATAMGDIMIMGTYAVEVSTQVSGKIIYAIPLAAIEEVRDRLKSPFLPVQEGEDKSETSSRLRAHLCDTEVDLRVVVDTAKVTLRQILNLRPGDFLQLNAHSMERASLWIEGKPLFYGRGAQHNGTKVFMVTERCSPDKS